MIDARALNWRFLVPDQPSGLLLLPVAEERVPGAVAPERSAEALADALTDHTYPAVVAPDAGAWCKVAGERAAGLLVRLAAAVAPGGYLYAGFSNPWYPARLRARGSLALKRELRILERLGFTGLQAYLAFPSQACPAYLVDASNAACLEYFVRRISIPYVERQGARARMERRALRGMRAIAMASPHATRVRFAPAAAVMGRRPA